MPKFVLAIDQGTTSTRTMLIDQAFNVIGKAQVEFPQHYPASGWVEHDCEDIWKSVVETAKGAVASSGVDIQDCVSIGITNQRETVVVWERTTGRPIYHAIVWQDRRTAAMTQKLRGQGHEDSVAKTTGLLLDPYFSASKIAWLLDKVDGARDAARRGELAFGTIDSFLIWRLSGGKRHVTDATNASRTLLFDIHNGQWSDDMLLMFDIPREMLPEVLDCAADFGVTNASLFGREIPICGVAGDQQAATVGQACFNPGMLKATYGTGCFAVLNTGTEPVQSSNRLLTTIAYRLKGKTTYALEGSIFVAGAGVQWLRDQLGFVQHAADTGRLAELADDQSSVYLVPAFVGLGAPYWDPDCRGALYGLTRQTGPNEITRAALESVCFQTLDLVDAMHADWSQSAQTILRVDGGMVASDWTMQRLADIIDAPVDRPDMLETTVLGAAYLAGMHVDLYGDPEQFAKTWTLEKRFQPQMGGEERARRIAGWRDAVARTLSQPDRTTSPAPEQSTQT